MDVPRGSMEEALYFTLTSMKLAVFRVDARLEALEKSFLREHPMSVLPALPETQEERELKSWAKERGLL